MKKLFISFLCCCFLIYGNLYPQIPEEFHGTYRVTLDYPFQDVAEQVYEALQNLSFNADGVRFYENDLSVGNMRSLTESRSYMIRPSRVVMEDGR